MCVHGGQIITESGAEVENLACYRQMSSAEDSFDLSRIPVVISDGSTVDN